MPTQSVNEKRGLVTVQVEERAERLLNLVMFLLNSPQPRSAQDIKDQVHHYRKCRTETSFKRALCRDVRTLRQLGVPVEVDANAEYRIQPKAYHLPVLEFSEGELNTLALASRVVSTVAPPLRERAESALRKLSFGHWDRLRRAEVTARKLKLQISPPHARLKTHAIKTVLDASEHRRTLRIRFQARASGETTTRLIDPYSVLLLGDEWYLVGYCHLRKDVRILNGVGIQAVEESNPSSRSPDFRPPQDFHLSVWAPVPRWHEGTNSPPFPAKVWFDREAWQRARNMWDRYGTAGERPDGRFLTIEVSNAQAFVSAVLEFGMDAELKEPEWLRSQVVGALQRIIEAHR